MKKLTHIALLVMMFAAPAFATVVINSPSNGAASGNPVHFVATSSTACLAGVASMGVYVNNVLKYVGNGASLNTYIGLDPGAYNAVVQDWDYCGGITKASTAITVGNQNGVSVSLPANNSTVSDPVNFVASATTGCAKGVAAMGVYVGNQRVYLVNGRQMNTQITLGSGTQKAVIQEWDNCGGSTATPVTVNVTSSAKTLSNLQASGGWNQWGELPPVYGICSTDPCGGGKVWWSMYQHVKANSKSGNMTQFNIGGSQPYSDVLWSNPIMGQGSTQGLPDTGRTLIPKIHNITYNADVYVTNIAVTQDLEFDVNMYLNGVGMEWGTECNHLADGVWDIWNNVNAKWIPTGVPCSVQNGWNHVALNVQREPNNDLLYKAITVNGKTYTINQTMAPFSVPTEWYGVTVNYQMDGDYKQSSNTTDLDNLSITYW
jgi:hypothetical protein